MTNDLDRIERSKDPMIHGPLFNIKIKQEKLGGSLRTVSCRSLFWLFYIRR